MIRTLLCVHPHPDDESIACGGVLARASEQGDRAVVVTCTGGEEGENLAGIDLGDRDIAVHRRDELAQALAVLGVSDHHWLGYRDSGMRGTPANDDPASFHRADLEEAARRLAAIIRRERPQVIVSDDADGSYGHPDHVKAHHVTVRAVALAADPTAEVAGAPWHVAKRYVHTLGHDRLRAAHRALRGAGIASPFGDEELGATLPFGRPEAEITTQIDVRGQLERKRAALMAHRSQVGPDSFFLNVPVELAEDVFGVEQYVLADGAIGEGPPERDLFAGIGEAGVAAAGSVEGDTA